MKRSAKPLTLLTAPELQLLERFCVLHQLKDDMVSLLQPLQEEHSFRNSGVSASASASYEQVLQSISKAIAHGWLTQGRFVSLLDAGELAGRQHVCLFDVRQVDQHK